MRPCLLPSLILVLGLGLAQTVSAQADNASDPLVRVLQAKGVLTDSEARAIMANGSLAEQRDRLAALLRDKGVISSTEFEAVRTASSSPEIKTITADYKTSALPASAEPQPTPSKIIAAVAPIRLLGIDVPKREGLIPDIKLGTGARLKLYGIFKTSIVHDSSSPAGTDFPLPLLASDTGPKFSGVSLARSRFAFGSKLTRRTTYVRSLRQYSASDLAPRG